jgi:hypothetical protein
MVDRSTDTPFRIAGDGVAPWKLALWCGVDPWTITRWERGISRAPLTAVRLVGILARGELPPHAGPSWSGWRFGHRDGLLYPPGFGRGLTPGQVASVVWLEQMSAWRTARLDLLAPLEPAVFPARGQTAGTPGAAHDWPPAAAATCSRCAAIASSAAG